MKTQGLGKFLFISFIFLQLFSCKEEEFYEKEFINTLSDKHEAENLPDEVIESIWEENQDDFEAEEVTNSEEDTSDQQNDSDSNPNQADTDDDEKKITKIEDNFHIKSSGQKLDILWVIDNSGSMGDEQKALGENFEAFIKEFIKKEIDFKMAITTTDTREKYAGKSYKNSIDLLTSDKLKANKLKFLNDFSNLVKVGVKGSGYEKGIKASEIFTQNYASQWLRDDAYLTIVYLSDEEDQSEKSVDSYLKSIQKIKRNNGLIKAYSIVDMVPRRKRGAIVRGYARYKEIVQKTGGEVASIKGSFYDTLLNMGEQISNLSQQYPLSKRPHEVKLIKVSVNEVINTEWLYDEKSNSIAFDSQHIPASGSKITISYDTEEEN